MLTHYQDEVNEFRITQGAVYVYLPPYPPGCQGHLYRVVRFIKQVPSYQENVLVKCLSGKDHGMLFACTLSNFASRYRPATPEEVRLVAKPVQPA